jgi:UDP-N-acetylmuramoylalanine--D-glutamate ligase
MSATDYRLPSTDYTRLRDKHVTVMGLGLHGGALGTIKWLHKQGAKITVTDLKTEQELAGSIEQLNKYPGIKLVLGQHQEEDFTGANLVIRNPAVPKDSAYLQAARRAGVPIEMDSSLFWQYSPSRDIVGITGSKGKTTTAYAIATVLQASDPEAVAVGIDGVSPLGELTNVKQSSPVVFELSSWRLEALDAHQLSPPTAVVTSIYREHLNTYRSFEEYIETKKVIFKHQQPYEITILNWDDQHIREWTDAVPAKLYWYSLQPLPAEEGIYIEDEVVRARLRNQVNDIFSTDVLPFHAEHEQRNLLPAILIGLLRNIPVPTIQQAIESIKRLPHRLEIVRRLDAVTYINDSASTMPDATIAALHALKTQSIVLIVGGGDKGLVFDGLAEKIAAANIRALIWLPGTATKRMQKIINPTTPAKIVSASDMQSAVQQARQITRPGDIALLSPGATSFGLFQHEFDRGNQFRAAVQQLQ